MTDAFDRLKAALADRYTIEREIGRGGMATVYLAEDLKHHRKVAVKVLRPELAAALGPERFLQEIEIAAQLHHPHILPLYDSGDADGFLYFIMPYEEGQSLRDKLNHEGELPIAEAVRILRDVVEALKHAHKHNVVHRDIKPDNVMLSEDHALVTDFGVAKAVSDATGAIGLTTEGVALGTPAYMAPEQAAADPHIDHRADIYAVGVIAYELLTGRTPFVGTTQQELLAAHVTQIPDPVTKYRESVPPALAQLVMKCLEKKAADRWQSAEELLPQLEALSTPSGGVTPTGLMPVDRVAKRRWMMVGGVAGIAVVIAVIAVMAALPRGSSVALDPNHVVVASFRNATGDPSLDQLGERVGHWVTQGIEQAAIPVTPWDMALQSWEYVRNEAAAGRIRDPIRALAEETGSGTVISGTIYAEADSLEIQVNVTDALRGRLLGSPAPVTALREAPGELIELATDLVMGFLSIHFDERLSWAAELRHPPSFEAYQAFSEGMRFQTSRRWAEAVPYLRRASELEPMWAQPLLRLHNALGNLGRGAAYDSVLSVLRGFGDRLSPIDLAAVQARLALRNGDDGGVLRAYRRAAELAPGSPLAYNLAFHAKEQNRPREALAVLETLNPERGFVRTYPTYWDRRTEVLHMLGEHERELEDARRAYRQHPDGGAYILCSQMRALAALGRLEELDNTLDAVENAPDVGEVRRVLVEAVAALRGYGYVDAAREVAERVTAWFEARPREEKVTARHRLEYGKLLLLVGRNDEAQRVFDALVVESPDDPFEGGTVGSFYLSVRAARAFTSAIRGDTAQALSDAEWFEGLEPPYAVVPFLWFGRVVIAGVLSDQERLMELIPDGERQWDFSWFDGVNMFFDPIRENPEFQELLRPKG